MMPGWHNENQFYSALKQNFLLYINHAFEE